MNHSNRQVKAKKIALLLGQDLGYCRDVLKGVRTYSTGKQDWIFRNASPVADLLKPLRRWKPDGIICHLFDQKVADGVLNLGVPTVNTTSTLDLQIPLVEIDHQLAGRMAAEYFLEKRFRNFGYVGSAKAGFSKDRESGFRNRLAEDGHSLSTCHIEYLPQPPLDERWSRIDTKVVDWLKKIDKPIAIFASNDVPARDLAEACFQLQISVPENVAILGVDNDEFLCGFGRPPLSSIAVPGSQVGFEAASMLDKLLGSDPPTQIVKILKPSHVVERQSTDIIAIDDPTIVEILKYIREHFADPITVLEIAEVLDVSRRKIERLFREKIGRSILDEIRNVRVTRAKELLANTSDSVEKVALKSGFSSGRRFAIVFRQLVNISPTEFRGLCR